MVNQESYWHRYGVYILFIIAVLPVLCLRDFTPANELRYVSIAHDALRDGNIFTFTNQGSYYSDKPPLYLWIVMGAYRLCGVDCMWLVGLFSLIPALFITEISIRLCGKALPVKMRPAARVMLLTSTLFLSMTFTLRMDMLMTLWILLAVRSMLNIYRNHGNLRAQQWLVGIYVFLALFTKGPMGVIIPLVGLIGFLITTGRIAQFGRYWGWRCWVPLIVLSLLWWGAAWLEGGNEYINALLFHQTVDRAVNAFHHKRPFYYYLINIWWCLAPWSLWVIAMLFRRIFGMRGVGSYSDTEDMYMSLFFLTFIILSCLSGKLPVYLLPIMPFAVIGAFMASQERSRGWERFLIALPGTALGLAGIAMAVGIWLPKIYQQLPTMIPLFSQICVALAGISLAIGMVAMFAKMYGNRKSLCGGVQSIGFAMMATLFFAGLAIPDFNYLVGLREVSERAKALDKEYNADKIYTMNISRAENIDVIMERPVTSTKNIDELKDKLEADKTAIVICPSKREIPDGIRYDVTLLETVHNKSIYYISPQ